MLPDATLSVINPALWTDPGANPRLRSEKPVTVCLIYGVAGQYSLNSAKQEKCGALQGGNNFH